MQEEYVSVHFGDVHFGADNPVTLYTELNEHLYGFVEENLELIDVIYLSGDYLEKALGFNDSASKLSHKFLYELITLCKNNNIRLRVIRGTATHDFNQLEHFRIYEDTPEDSTSPLFRVIDKVESEYVFPNYRVLYVPEEYPKDSKAYYKEFMEVKTPYNIIVGHGTFEFQSFSNQKQESERPIFSAPVFSMTEFDKICSGPIIFGHIHTRCNWKNKIFYHGSFSRTAQGEPKEKGFCYAQVNVKAKEFLVEYVDNTSAPEYKTYEYDKLLEKYLSLDKVFNALKTLSKKYHKVRVRLAESYPNERLSEIAVLREAMYEFRNVEVTTRKMTSEEISKHEVVEESINEDGEVETHIRDSTYDFLIDGHLEPYETISKYLELTERVKLQPEEIQALLEVKE